MESLSMSLLSIRTLVRSTYFSYKSHAITILGSGLVLGGLQALYIIAMHVICALVTPGLRNNRHDGELLAAAKRWLLKNGFSVEYFSGSQVALIGLFQVVGFLLSFVLYFGVIALALNCAYGRSVSLKDMIISRQQMLRTLRSWGAYLLSFFALLALAMVAGIISVALFFRGTPFLKNIGLVVVAGIFIGFFFLLITYSLFMFCSIDRPVTGFGALKLSECLIRGHRFRFIILLLTTLLANALLTKLVYTMLTYSSFYPITQDALLATTMNQVLLVPCISLVYAHAYVQLYSARTECHEI